ncbi:MAG: hypothetical protein ACRD2G_17760 [Terriglobia bacterium]
MPRRAKKDTVIANAGFDPGRVVALSREDAVAGIAGPGRWLVAEYQPTTLFSLKTSQATSSVGVSLVIPTPYSIKMALVDAAFRAGFGGEQDCGDFLRSLANVELRIAPAAAAVVTNTFLKIRQESRGGDPAHPYGPAIAYREMIYLQGAWLWGFDLACGDDLLAQRLVRLAPYVNYIGKRGSFVQYRGLHRSTELGPRFTQPLESGASWAAPARAHVRPLDDFGPGADLETLSSFTEAKPKRDRHRKFISTIIPVGIVNSGPGFSEYRKD